MFSYLTFTLSKILVEAYKLASSSFRSSTNNIAPRQRQHFSAPKFYAVPHNRVVEEGECVTFQCAISGHPSPWSTWDKHGTIVTPSSRITIKERDDLRLLEIEQVTIEDAGLYRITLENDYGRIEATARLDVIGRRGSATRMLRTTSASPRRSLVSSKRLMGNSTRIGGRLALACDFRGSSTPPAKKFYHNGEEVVETDRIKIIKVNDSKIILQIDDAQLSDEGEYTCLAESSDGIATSFAYVRLFESEKDIPRDPPIIIKHMKPILNVNEGSTVDLKCHIECFESYIVTWMRDDQVISDSNDFRYYSIKFYSY